MQRFLPIGVVTAGLVLAFATLFVALRASAPTVTRARRPWRRALAEVVDEFSDKIQEALE